MAVCVVQRQHLHLWLLFGMFADGQLRFELMMLERLFHASRQ
jgi:hypothetical protein